MPKVSIIIPVYNTEPYLRRCLDSLVRQTLEDIEIICVNDGSTDGSEKIILEYAAKDYRIKLISLNTNMGAAKARNQGLAVACGEYLGFVDSDDYVDLAFYEKLYAAAADCGAEISKASIRVCASDGSIQIIGNEEVKKSRYNFLAFYTTAIYQNLFLQAHSITFPEGIIWGEDLVFSNKAVLYANAIAFAEDIFYTYCTSANRTDDATPKILQTYLDALEMIIDELNRHFVDENGYRIIFMRQIDLVWQAFFLAKPEDRTVCADMLTRTLIKFYTKCHDRETTLSDKDYVIWYASLISKDIKLSTDIFSREVMGAGEPHSLNQLSTLLKSHEHALLAFGKQDACDMPNCGVIYAYYIRKYHTWSLRVESGKREEASLLCAEAAIRIFANSICQALTAKALRALNKAHWVPFLVTRNVAPLTDIFLDRMSFAQKRMSALRVNILITELEKKEGTVHNTKFKLNKREE